MNKMKGIIKMHININIKRIMKLIFVFTLVCCFICKPTNLMASEEVYGNTDIENKIYATLRSVGYTHEAVCGILGNIAVENPDFKTDLYSNNGYTYGLFQWSKNADRQKRLHTWCNNRLLKSDSLEGQLAFAVYEIDGGDSIATRLEEYLETTDDTKMAATEFAAGFERCIGNSPNIQNDGVYEGTIYPEYYGEYFQALSKRVEAAKKYDEVYSKRYVNINDILDVATILNKEIDYNYNDNIKITVQKESNIEREYSNLVLCIFRCICIIIGYAFGSVLASDIVARMSVKKSIFQIGDRIPHLRNVILNVGKKEAVAVVALEILKIFIAMVLSYLLTRNALGNLTVLWTGLGLVVGGDYPFWNGFRGGYGVTVSALVYMIFMPYATIVCSVIGFVIARLLKSYSLGVISTAILLILPSFSQNGVFPGIWSILILLLLVQRNYAGLRKEYFKYREPMQEYICKLKSIFEKKR